MSQGCACQDTTKSAGLFISVQFIPNCPRDGSSSGTTVRTDLLRAFPNQTVALPTPVGDYEYDVRVKACAGTSSSSIRAYFCSNSACDGATGEEELIKLEMNDVEGGWTDVSFPLPFNPLAVRLEDADGNDAW